ncbi:MAG: hypothetical protein K2X93_25845, partial [Candidatus Obscuribacterales bacterium]|nr:hypothetical protein [Candidatus Obscuribacterales bacterium]
GLPDYDAFADHIRFNSLFRSFVGLGKADMEWDSYRYKQVHIRWTVDQELREFMTELLEALTQLPIRPDDIMAFEMCNQIEDRLSKWIDQHCPKAVYFHQFQRAPIKRYFASLSFQNGDSKGSIESIMTPPAAMKLKKAFPKEGEPEETEFGVEDLVFLSDNEDCSLLINFEKVSLSSNPEHFEAWEETVNPYLIPMIEFCSASEAFSLAQGASLNFGNVISLPREVNLTDFFHMLPSLPPKVVPPRLMREENLSYAFPSRVTRTSYTTDLLYDSNDQALRCSYEITTQGDSQRVELDLEAQWTSAFPVIHAEQVFNDLKNNLYIAFHSLITDRTRSLFE